MHSFKWKAAVCFTFSLSSRNKRTEYEWEMIEFCLRTERTCLREGKKAVARRLSTRKCRLEDRPMSRCTSLEHDYLPASSRGSWRDSLLEDLQNAYRRKCYIALLRHFSHNFIHMFPHLFFHNVENCQYFLRKIVLSLKKSYSMFSLIKLFNYFDYIRVCTYYSHLAGYLCWRFPRNSLELYMCRYLHRLDLPWWL